MASKFLIDTKLGIITLQENIEAFSDGVTYYLHRVLPISLQNYFRDSGTFQYLADKIVSILAGFYAILMPECLFQFIELGRKMKISQYGPTSDHTYQLFQIQHQSLCIQPRKSKTLFFVHGGGWGSGQSWMYRLIAVGLGHSIDCDTVITISYPVFPKASILEQSECIRQAIDHAKSDQDQTMLNILDSTIVLAGHSSGANISALACLHAAQAYYKLADLFIGFGGVYDVAKHYLFEARRGVHELSPMGAAARGKNNFDFCSPIQIARSTSFPRNLFPQTLLIHGRRDTTVPVSSSEEFADVLSDLRINVTLEYHLVRIKFSLLDSST